MTEQSIDLKQLERKVWKSFFEDGIWDIYLGLLLMAMAIGTLLSDSGASQATQGIVYLSLVGVASLFLWLGKHFITVPLIGHVKFGSEGKTRTRKTVVVLAASVLVGLIAFSVAALSVKGSMARAIPMDLFLPAIWVGNMLIVFSLAAHFLRFNRLYLIGALFAVAIPLDIVLKELLHRDLTFVAFGVPALVILIMGGIVLTRFLRKYSRLKKE